MDLLIRVDPLHSNRSPRFAFPVFGWCRGCTGIVTDGFLPLALGIFAFVAVPVIIGMAARRFATGAAVRFEPTARVIAVVLFILVVIAALIQERENIVSYLGQSGPVMLVLNLVMMLVAYLVARLTRAGAKQQIAIVMECGLQNGTLAITAATILFGGVLFAVPAASYSMTMFATALLLVWILRRANRAD